MPPLSPCHTLLPATPLTLPTTFLFPCHTPLSLTCLPLSFPATCSPSALLGTQVDAIVRALHKQLRDKSVKTRQGCFSLLTALMTVLPGALGNHVGALVPGILYCLK